MMKQKLLVLLASLIVSSGASAAYLSLLSGENFARFDGVSSPGTILHYDNSSSNGGFSGWTVANIDILNNEAGALTPTNSNNGSTDFVSLRLNDTSNMPSFISRTFNTFIGSTYTVAFNAGSDAQILGFGLSFGGQSLSLASNSNYGTTGVIPLRRYEFFSSASTATLTFSGGSGGVVLDNISVFTLNAPDPVINNPVPLPGVLGLLALGLGLMVRRARRT
jgi:hypothetical protein